MVTMNDIIAFVEKAMECNFNVKVWGEYGEIDIIQKNPDKYIEIKPEWIERGTFKTIYINKPELNYYTLNNLTELEVASFKFLCARVREYSINKTLEYFNNFFKEEESKLKDINDLDDKED